MFDLEGTELIKFSDSSHAAETMREHFFGYIRGKGKVHVMESLKKISRLSPIFPGEYKGLFFACNIIKDQNGERTSYFGDTGAAAWFGGPPMDVEQYAFIMTNEEVLSCVESFALEFSLENPDCADEIKEILKNFKKSLNCRNVAVTEEAVELTAKIMKALKAKNSGMILNGFLELFKESANEAGFQFSKKDIEESMFRTGYLTWADNKVMYLGEKHRRGHKPFINIKKFGMPNGCPALLPPAYEECIDDMACIVRDLLAHKYPADVIIPDVHSAEPSGR